MKTGDRIRQRRKELGLTAEQVAEKLGKNRATIYRYESNEIENLPSAVLEPLAEVLSTTPANLMGWDVEEHSNNSKRSIGIKIPVLGKISAGLPLYATEDIIDYEEISEEQNRTGEFFCLQINGSSMEPRMTTGDVVVVRKQKNVENGEIAVVIVNGNDATVKKVKHTEEGLILIPTNPTYETIYYTSKEVRELPVKIIGKVVELRAKF